MIFAETTETTTRYAQEYSFIGPARDTERMELLDAGEGLQRIRRITRLLFDSLVKAVHVDEPIRKDTVAAEALHAVLRDYKSGLVRYYDNIGTEIDESDIITPRIIGADGLGRRVTIVGLEVDARPIPAEILEGLEPSLCLGVTHMVEQYNFSSAEQQRHLNVHPIAHVSLGVHLDGKYTARQTLLTNAIIHEADTGNGLVEHFRQTVTVAADVVKVAPRY